jgi:hypothetical protein
LEPGQELRVRARITHIIADPERWRAEVKERQSLPLEAARDLPPVEPYKTEAIPPGAYELQVMIAVTAAGHDFWLFSSSLERIRVQLGGKRPEPIPDQDK